MTTEMPKKKSRGRARKDPLGDAIRVFATLTEAEYSAAQDCVTAMRALAATRAVALVGSNGDPD